MVAPANRTFWSGAEREPGRVPARDTARRHVQPRPGDGDDRGGVPAGRERSTAYLMPIGLLMGLLYQCLADDLDMPDHVRSHIDPDACAGRHPDRLVGPVLGAVVLPPRRRARPQHLDHRPRVAAAGDRAAGDVRLPGDPAGHDDDDVDGPAADDHDHDDARRRRPPTTTAVAPDRPRRRRTHVVDHTRAASRPRAKRPSSDRGADVDTPGHDPGRADRVRLRRRRPSTVSALTSRCSNTAGSASDARWCRPTPPSSAGPDWRGTMLADSLTGRRGRFAPVSTRSPSAMDILGRHDQLLGDPEPQPTPAERCRPSTVDVSATARHA